MIPGSVRAWLEQNGFGEVISSRRVGGGCINQGTILATDSGASFFLKTNTETPGDMFAREAECLEALAVPGAPKVPRPFYHGENFLLLEDLAPASRKAEYWPDFGRKLATLHKHTNPQFGFQHDNYIGSTPQPNPWTEDGHTFFAQQRLLFQARMALRRGLLNSGHLSAVENLAARLPALIPAQPACLIHGDLWSGNALTDSGGNPAIIDPAAHYGWAEADLAMTDLFGSFPEAFYDAYQEVRPLERGYPARFQIYNLYHLLNHLNLFGSGYLGQVSAVLGHYGN